MEIVYVITSLATTGGTERIVSEKASYLADVFGYDVSIVCYGQNDDSPNFYFPSAKVKQINLGLKIYSQYRYKYPKRIWVKYNLRNRLKKSLSKVVNEINPDILIGITHFRADIVCNINCKAKKIIESHIPRYSIEVTNKKRNYLINSYKKFYDRRYFHIIEKKADMIITLTKDEIKQWTKAKQVKSIPNFSNIQVNLSPEVRKKRVITIGRLSEEKGFDRLLDIWKSIIDKHPDWQLDIYGEGGMKEKLEQIIKTEIIANVTMRGTTNNIGKEISESSICVVTSYFEGFSLVLLEAIKFGVPCVAFDCPYGPKAIIEDGICGYLIENGNTPLFAEKLCTLMENESLRQDFSKASIERSKVFDKDTIMSQWKKLFEEFTY